MTAQSVKIFMPDLVGVTSMYNNSIFAEELLGIAKSVRPTSLTVAAGPHFGANAVRSVERNPNLDAAISGEGEVAVEMIARHLDGQGPLNAVPNIAYRNSDCVTQNALTPLIDLGAYDFNVWETCVQSSLLDLGRYVSTIPENADLRSIYLEAGRGCPFDCTFCAPAQFWLRKYRLKSPLIIASEIRYLYENAGYNYFLLVHDLLTANRARALEVATEIERLNIPVQWMANSRIDIDLTTELPIFRRSGLRKFFFGVETATDRLQAEIGKRLIHGSAGLSVANLREEGITATCSFVIGLPSETSSELSRTIGYGAQLALIGAETVQFHRLRLFPPAPLAVSELKRDFDPETLELEFPFSEVHDEEADAIQADPIFFSGYFAPASKAGTPQQLSQVELIFQQLVTLAPFTLAALHNLCGDQLVEKFYDWLRKHVSIPRAVFTASKSALEVWNILRPIVEGIASLDEINEAAFLLVHNALEYDTARMKFLSPSSFVDRLHSDKGDSGAVVALDVDISRAFELLSAGRRPDKTIIEPSIAIFVRGTDGTAVAMRAKA